LRGAIVWGARGSGVRGERRLSAVPVGFTIGKKVPRPVAVRERSDARSLNLPENRVMPLEGHRHRTEINAVFRPSSGTSSSTSEGGRKKMRGFYNQVDVLRSRNKRRSVIIILSTHPEGVVKE